MRKLFVSLILLFITYYLVQYFYFQISKGYTKEYLLLTDYEYKITETYSANKKEERDNYHFNISVNDTEFSLQTYHDFEKKQKVIIDVKYFENNEYKCIFPIFRDNLMLFDVICKYDDFYINYTAIKEKPEDLTKFVNNLNTYKNNFKEDLEETEKSDFIRLYKNNTVDNHYIGITTYKGVSIIADGKIKVINLFESDYYKRPISGFVQNYYITANYDKTLEFNDFYLVNLATGKIEKMFTKHLISFDSYFMGTVDEAIYLLDKERKQQYEIDVSISNVLAIGNTEIGAKIYSVDDFVNLNMSDTINTNKMFEYTTNSKYGMTFKEGNKYSGYYYYFENQNDKCSVYRSNIQDQDKRLYLFDLNNCNDVFYLEEYIYFINENNLYYYSDITGIRTLTTNDELEFNDDIKISGFVQKEK